MTYQNEDVLADHTCILEVWKTDHRKVPDDLRAIDAASATQTFLGYREGPLYWIRQHKPPQETYSHGSIPLRASNWFGETLDFTLPPGEDYNPNAELHIGLQHWHKVIKEAICGSVKRGAVFDNAPITTDNITPPRPDLKHFLHDQGKRWM
ncbi:hypothetical protein K440DRAFT_636739 [Wilcoxina mikolae CBS 423.85]|nr:hypothetical protein K440DRAFT_636739 [Wilcoxina mikolae CBS 423.85]